MMAGGRKTFKRL